MDGILEAIRDFFERGAGPTALAILFAAAALEYVFPPFPGDTVTLLGAFMVARYGWSGPAVFAVLLAGSAAGAMADFYAGRWLGARGRFWSGERARLRARIDRILASFRRHGEAYLLLNRFVPVLRAFFFVAAGMAGLRAGYVLLFASISAAAWNALVFAAGFAVGTRFDRLLALFRAYSLAAWGVLGVVAIAWLVRRVWRR